MGPAEDAILNPPEADASDGASRSSRIKADIAETRADMDDTMQRLGERLRPRSLLDDFFDLFRDGGEGRPVAEYGKRALEKIKEHPIPAALVGAGLAWLILESSESDDASAEPDEPGAWARARIRVDEARERVSEAAGSVRQKASDISDAASDWATWARQSLAGTAETAREAATSAASRAGQWTAQAGAAMKRGREAAAHTADEYPLAVGAGVLALGVLTGLLLPRSRSEDRWLGEHADELKRRARDTGEDLLARGKQVVSETANDMAQEARRQGLAPSELAERAKRVVSETTARTSEAARNEGLSPDELGEKVRHVVETGKEKLKSEIGQQVQSVQGQPAPHEQPRGTESRAAQQPGEDCPPRDT